MPHLRKIIRLGDQHTSGMLNFAAILQLGREDMSANGQTHIDTDTSSFDVCPPSTHLSSRMHSIRRHINSRLTSRSTMQDYTDVLSYLHHALQFDDAINIQFTSGTTVLHFILLLYINHRTYVHNIYSLHSIFFFHLRSNLRICLCRVDLKALP